MTCKLLSSLTIVIIMLSISGTAGAERQLELGTMKAGSTEISGDKPIQFKGQTVRYRPQLERALLARDKGKQAASFFCCEEHSINCTSADILSDCGAGFVHVGCYTDDEGGQSVCETMD